MVSAKPRIQKARTAQRAQASSPASVTVAPAKTVQARAKTMRVPPADEPGLARRAGAAQEAGVTTAAPAASAASAASTASAGPPPTHAPSSPSAEMAGAGVVAPTRYVAGYRCIACGRTLDWGRTPMGCPGCGGNLDIVYDYQALRRARKAQRAPMNAWGTGALRRTRGLLAWWPLLPFEGLPSELEAPLLRTAGAGPLLAVDGGDDPKIRLYIKDDTRNPSGSFKDRATLVTLARARAEGHSIVATASTGNAAASLACIAAAWGMKAVVFVPRTAPAAKIAQLVAFGATVLAIDGTYDQAFDLCLRACAQLDIYCRSTGVNPHTREGKKTVAYEILFELGGRVPDWVVVPVGDGNIISGVAKGFSDLVALGLADHLPRLAAIQSERSAAVAESMDRGVLVAVEATSRADSINVNLPRDGLAAMKAVQTSGGVALKVSDASIMASIGDLARRTGIFLEPAAAAAWAGLTEMRARCLVQERDRVVLLATGTGLKDPLAGAGKSTSIAPIPPELGAVRAALASLRAGPTS